MSGSQSWFDKHLSWHYLLLVLLLCLIHLSHLKWVESNTEIVLPATPVVIAQKHIPNSWDQLKLPLYGATFFLMFTKNDKRSCTSSHKTVHRPHNEHSLYRQFYTTGFICIFTKIFPWLSQYVFNDHIVQKCLVWIKLKTKFSTQDLLLWNTTNDTPCHCQNNTIPQASKWAQFIPPVS